MTRIVVVSRNPSLAWGLAAPERDLEEVRPHQIDGWLLTNDGPPADLIVLDLTEAGHSLTVLTALRAHAHLSPALLVAGDDPSWSASPLQDLPGAEVLALPVTTDSLQAAVERLMTGYPVTPVEPSVVDVIVTVEERSDTEVADGEPAVEEATATTPAVDEPETVPQPGSVPEQRREVGRHAKTSATEPVATPQAAEAPDVTPVPIAAFAPTETVNPPAEAAPPAPAAPPALRRSPRTSDTVREALAGADFSHQVADIAHVTEASSQASKTLSGSPVAPAAGVPPWPAALDKPTRPMDNANALARALTLRVDELYGVPETAEVIALDAVERTQADYAALLLPDGDRWRVAAGVGLGNVERRFELEQDSWVVTNVARASKGVIVEESDIARRPFASAPLSSRRHLLAAPIRLVEGILLVARDEDPSFDEDALTVLATLAEEAGLLLAAAIDVRELARRLQPLTDYVD